jgi:hypothetical protein
MSSRSKFAAGLLLGFLCLRGIAEAPFENSSVPVILGLTGRLTDVRATVETPQTIAPLSAAIPGHDIDLQRMAAWAMNYLIRTPNKDLDYEPVFQCHPLRCPPVPQGHDVVVPCDTDARMNWEWYYMRDISGSSSGRNVEEGFHQRILAYVQDDGTVLCPPGCYNEGDINKVYQKTDYVYHIWGATKILHALAEDFRRTGNKQSKAMARKIMLRLKKLTVYPTPDKCYFPGGMGPVRLDGTLIPNGWNKQPAPLVEPLVNYYLATGDKEALDFAKAYAEGIMAGIQPGGIRIGADGNFGGGHGHATLHALWGIAHLGVVTGQARYVNFVKRSWDWMLSQGTGTGWFPAAPIWADNCNETCCVSDMTSIAALIGRSGHTEYFDYVERYLRNYISNLQFIITPEFEACYRKINAAAGKEKIEAGLKDLRKFQGGIIGGSGLNDYENVLLDGVSGFEMFGCCAPEGMRAIYTAWDNVIQRLPRSELGLAGVYVNLALGRDSKWGCVVSFYPDAGRLTVKAKVRDRFFLRPPHWAPRKEVRAFVGTRSVPVKWSGAYVCFDKVAPGDEVTITYPLISFSHEVEGLWRQYPKVRLTFQWLGNSVISSDPAADRTPLFGGKPRLLPPPPMDDFAEK